MKKQFGINNDGVHLMIGGGVEYALCGFPVTVDPEDQEAVEVGNIEPTPITAVSCPTCKQLIKLCRGVVIDEDELIVKAKEALLKVDENETK